MLYKIIDWICENVPGDNGKVFKPEDFSFFHFDFHKNLYQRALAFVFLKKRKDPAFVIKYSKSSRYNTFLEEESQRYRELYLLLSDHLKRSIPEPIFIFKEGNNTAFIERGIPGTSLKNLIKSNIPTKEIIQYLKKACAWISDLQEETKCPVKATEFQFKKFIYDPVRLFIDKHQIPHKQKEVLMNVSEDIHREFKGCWTFAACHGDFWLNNIIVNNGSIGIVDWTSLQKEYLPYWDFFTLLFNLNINSYRYNNKEIELFTKNLETLKDEFLQIIGIRADMEQKVYLLFITTRSVWNELHYGYSTTWDSIWKKRYDEHIKHFL